MIEEKLQRDIGREWAKEVNKSGSSVKDNDKFPFLLKFLLEQRKIIEYQSADLRNTIPCMKRGIHGIDESEDDDEQKRLSKCLILGNSNHLTGNCSVYLDLPPNEKVNLVKEHQAYYLCLKVGHRSWDCRIREQCTQDGCTEYHHESLHLAHSSGANFHTNGAVGNKKTVNLAFYY